jgi:hypothetical protein
MQILRDAADQQIVKPLRTHGWDVDAPTENQRGEYLLISAQKAGVTRRMALLYTTGIDKIHYKALDGNVDAIFVNGEPRGLSQATQGVTLSVESVSDFFPTLVQWNKAVVPNALPPARPRVLRKTRRYITAERPLDGIWARLDHLASVQIAEKLVRQRASAAGVALDERLIRSKAAGMAFSVRSASDYFRSVPYEAMNKRILSSYYGTLALAFAEMLASPSGPADLDEVEGMTKLGHGLYTLPSATQDFGGLNVGVLASGFFPRYAAFLGYDTASFPKAKPKTLTALSELPRRTTTTLCDALGAVPELAELFVAVFDAPPSWVVPNLDADANPGRYSLRASGRSDSTYVSLLDPSKRMSLDRIVDAGWPVAESKHVVDDDEGRHFLVRVDHAGYEYWHEALPIHRSPFENRSTLIVPVVAGIVEYRVAALTLLYAFSIMVRYMPGLWRRVEGGDSDQHLVLVRTAINVFERILPEQYLEAITDEGIHVSQPGALF